MRDLLLLGFMCAAVYFTFKRPLAGLAAWVWIALMAPAKWAFGFSQDLRLNLTIVLFTALSYFVWKEKPKPQFTSIHFWVLFFGFWMLISTVFNLRVDSGYAWMKYNEFVKVLALFVFITLILKSRKDINTFIWAVVLGLSAYAAMEAVKFVLSAGAHRIVGRSGIIADRNDLAVAINMCLPLVVYLWSCTEDKKLKLGLLALALLNVLAIVGTYSRGGFIGLIILALAMWLKSNRKIIYLVIALMALPVLYANAPEDWKERQSTVETATTQDGSFIGRIWAWKIATLIAIDNPMTGGGFKATTDPILWRIYAPETPLFGPVETPVIEHSIEPKAAHNIYFQVLGSAGFVGLFIFLSMMITGFWVSLRNASKAKKNGVRWCQDLSNAISLAFVGYGVTGLNVSLAYFELVYAFLAIIAVIKSRELYAAETTRPLN
ncbi:putative O-glycosylation ligase, exosortase A system-associated [Thalassotalea euphylliae]|uniref:Putative O-glycosylation ligase, exosortase A system-associated n=1 Tax=Thalassotalea euphylliae TaxID=1655234 RepID=A0A3E0TKX8_9GAMM|nr:putative O-glycosylation ligase, exosortase A system-associated [Thalassotalea euphylliae]REL25204.1 putative O-glycosylation ligase, exosortase A system-associated [Thalassotalea euphylliae]